MCFSLPFIIGCAFCQGDRLPSLQAPAYSNHLPGAGYDSMMCAHMYMYTLSIFIFAHSCRCSHTYIPTYLPTYLHTYIPTYLHTYIPTYLHTHTYIPTYLHTYIPTYPHTYLHTYIHTFLHTCMHACIHTYRPTYMHRYMHTCMLAYMHTSIPYLCAYIIIHTYLCIHNLT